MRLQSRLKIGTNVLFSWQEKNETRVHLGGVSSTDATPHFWSMKIGSYMGWFYRDRSPENTGMYPDFDRRWRWKFCLYKKLQSATMFHQHTPSKCTGRRWESWFGRDSVGLLDDRASRCSWCLGLCRGWCPWSATGNGPGGLACSARPNPSDAPGDQAPP